MTAMDPDRWAQVVRLYQTALERQPAERDSFLAEASRGDEALRREVESLLAQDHQAGPLDRPMWEAAADLLDVASELSAGSCLGPYRIDRVLGAGGMGQVYRATDTRLDRTVAIKILPSTLSTDPQFRERFDREAKAIAALAHPHICALFDVGREQGVDFLVLEHLEGETLAARLEKGPLSLDEALRCAIEIGDALATAHRHGIVHRDLKPGNIMLTRRGAKLLDFGLAKTVAPVVLGATPSVVPTTPRNLTTQGAILGTFQYMAPEQLEGQPADARTDIFAFGAVIYEMLTGRKAFEGKSQASLIGAILKDDPPRIDKSQPLTPPFLDHVVRRCLAKDPDERWQSAGDVTRELKWIAVGGAQAIGSTPLGARSPDRERRAWMVTAGASMLAIAALALGAWMYISRAPADRSVYRATIALPSDVRFPGIPPSARLAMSPDGRSLAYVLREADGAQRLWIRSLDSATARPLAGTERASSPFWSPDSRFLAFFTPLPDSKLKKIDVAGGRPVTVCDLPLSVAPFGGGTWNRDGVILLSWFGAGATIQRIPASGGALSPVTRLDDTRGETQHLYPFFLPDGRHFVYVALGRKGGAGNEPNGVYVASIDSTARTLLLPGGSNAQYAQGHLVFLREHTLMAQSFDPATLDLQGEAMPLAEHVLIEGGFGGPGASMAGFAVSERAFSYIAGENEARTQLVWCDRAGKQIGMLGDPAQYVGVELSPDGMRAAVTLVNTTLGNDIWLFDVTSGLRTRFTFDGGDKLTPIWSPSGDRVLFRARGTRGANDLHQTAANGGGGDGVLLSDNLDKTPASWSPDGRFLLYTAFDRSQRDDDLWVMPLVGGAKPFRFTQTPFRELPGRFSPDGRWIAYASNESGRNEVFVAPFPGPGGKWQISTDGGVDPRWRRDGDELFYVSPDSTLMAAKVSGKGSGFEVGAVHPLFKATRMRTSRYEYDVIGDGQRFLVNTLIAQPEASIELIVNWTAALRK